MVKAGGPETKQRLTIVEILNPAGYAPPMHRHLVEDESLYIISGTALFESDGQRFTVQKGNFVFLPQGSTHTFRRAGGVLPLPRDHRPGRLRNLRRRGRSVGSAGNCPNLTHRRPFTNRDRCTPQHRDHRAAAHYPTHIPPCRRPAASARRGASLQIRVPASCRGEVQGGSRTALCRTTIPTDPTLKRNWYLKFPSLPRQGFLRDSLREWIVQPRHDLRQFRTLAGSPRPRSCSASDHRTSFMRWLAKGNGS